jgi:branched-chain amino acid transport system substrate-binding protein
MEQDGWKVIAKEVVKIDQADYSVQMSKLRALKAGVLYTVQTSPAAAASLCKSFRESGVRSFFMAIYTPSNPEYIKLTGKASETLVWGVSLDWVPAFSKEFLERYKKRFKEDPGQNVGLQYDAMMNVFAAMKLANSEDPRMVAEAMLKIKNKGNMGVYQYDPVTHEARSGNDFVPVRIYQILGGKHYAVYPDEFKEITYKTQNWLK